MTEFGFRTAKNGSNCMSQGTVGQGASRRGFRGPRGGWGWWWIGAHYLPFWPQSPILVGYLVQLAYVALVRQAGAVGKFRQIVGAPRPYGEQVKTPGRSSQMGRLR